MTLPSEITRAVIETREFLVRLASPSNGGFKGVPSGIRSEALLLLRHYPRAIDLGRRDSWDKDVIKRATGEK